MLETLLQQSKENMCHTCILLWCFVIFGFWNKSVCKAVWAYLSSSKFGGTKKT